MKIGYIVPEFPGLTHAFFWREVKALEDAGAEVRLFSTQRPAQSACPHAFREAATARTRYLFPPSPTSMVEIARYPAGVVRASGYVLGLHETRLPGRLRLLALVGSAADLARQCRQEDITHVHIHSCATAAHLGALAQRLGGPTYSLTLHGDLPVYGTDHAAKFAGASFVSAVTELLAADVRALSPTIHAPVIWMGVDTDRFGPADPPRRPRSPGDPFEVVTVARLNNTKGHRHFLAAMARVCADGIDLRYRIAGEGPERDRIASEIERLGLTGRVTMLGAVGEDDVLAMLRQADAMALTSFGQGEATPVTVMEAMACGVPTICSIIGGTPAMITDGVDGFLVQQRDEGAIADAIRRLAADPPLASRMHIAARRKAVDRFDYRVSARKLLTEIETTTHRR